MVEDALGQALKPPKPYRLELKRTGGGYRNPGNRYQTAGSAARAACAKLSKPGRPYEWIIVKRCGSDAVIACFALVGDEVRRTG